MVDATIYEAIHSFLNSFIDDEILSYLAGMIQEEGLPGINKNSLYDLIGPFIIDSNAASDDKEGLELCQKIMANLYSKFGFKESEQLSSNHPNGTLTYENKQPQLESMTIKDYISKYNSDGYHDPFLGIRPTDVNYNSSIPISESIKLHKANQKDKDRKEMILREWEKMKTPLPPLEKRHNDKNLAKMTDIILDGVSVLVAGKELLKDSSLRLVMGRKYGLIGRNGVGKSSLLRALVRREISGIHPDISIGFVEQDLLIKDSTIIQCVLDIDFERSALLKESEQLENEPYSEKSGNRLTQIYERLNEIEANEVEEKVQDILTGLGIPPEMQTRSLLHLSGGERMRVALARALFADPDILFLDEPSNHLDLHALAWLTQHLQNLKKTVVIVSHARQLLNDICTDIILFADKSLSYFKGNYDEYEEAYATQIAVQKRQFEAQEQKKKHMQQFIDRFRYNAKRASLVQSRIKALQKLPMLEMVMGDPTTKFDFADTSEETLTPPILQMDHVSFSYTSDTQQFPILKDVNLTIGMDSRIAICGVNGSGKSTLLSLLIKNYEPTSGTVRRNNKLRIGMYSQEHMDQLDLTLTAAQQLQQRYPDDNISDEAARTYLGKFGITKLLAIEPLYVLSGGQKSRVCIALMAFKNPNLLILDEPTNHLDMDAIQALLVSLKTFSGGVVVVSHDAFFLENLCEEVWHVQRSDHSCRKVSNSFRSYWNTFLKRTHKDSNMKS